MSNPTKAQIKAMEWLANEVGAGWKIGGGRMVAALSSAGLHGYVDSEWGDLAHAADESCAGDCQTRDRTT